MSMSAAGTPRPAVLLRRPRRGSPVRPADRLLGFPRLGQLADVLRCGRFRRRSRRFRGSGIGRRVRYSRRSGVRRHVRFARCAGFSRRERVDRGHLDRFGRLLLGEPCVLLRELVLRDAGRRRFEGDRLRYDDLLPRGTGRPSRPPGGRTGRLLHSRTGRFVGRTGPRVHGRRRRQRGVHRLRPVSGTGPRSVRAGQVRPVPRVTR